MKDILKALSLSFFLNIKTVALWNVGWLNFYNMKDYKSFVFVEHCNMAVSAKTSKLGTN